MTAPVNPHQPIPGEEDRLRCAAPECDYTLHVHRNPTIRDPAQFWPEQFRRHHGDQYNPGRAPDIAVDWVVSASCSVCPDGIGEIEASDDGEGVWCQECGTTWSIDGTAGERAEP